MKYLQSILAAAVIAGFTTAAFAADSNTTTTDTTNSMSSAPAAAPAAEPASAPATHTEEAAPAKQSEDAAPAPEAKPAAHKAHHATHHAATHHAATHHAMCKKDKKGHCMTAKPARTVETPVAGPVRHRKWMGTPNSMNNPAKD